MTASSGPVDNSISGGTQYGPVLQGRDFRDVHIQTVVQAAAAPVALAQLPPLDTGFTGRDREMAAITELLSPGGGAGAVVVSAVAGLAGVGKTVLAVQAARAAQAAGWFPGGVLFIDLHGYDAAPVQAGQALDAFLRALGVPGERIPAGTAERGALYRSALAAITDPVLIVVDNASSEAQVRPVLPGPGPHRVIVTSRHTLAGLRARLLDVEVLGEEDAVALLDGTLRMARPGDGRITDDDAGARRLAGACGGLPLALCITGALLVADPALAVEDLAGELADETRRLAALRYDDGRGSSALSVAAAFELSYRQLDREAARLFRLAPVNPGPDLSTQAAAALAGISSREARAVLGQLARAHLVQAAAGPGRWRMHDLLRLYARQISGTKARKDRRERAWDRLLGFYARTTRAADVHLRALPGMPVPEDFTGRADALAWLDAERPNLIAAVTMAAGTGREHGAMTLGLTLAEYLRWRRRFDDWLHVSALSRDAARSLGDRANEAGALTILGNALLEIRRFEEGIVAHHDAVAIFQETGDLQGEGMALNNLGAGLREMGRYAEAVVAHQDAVAIFREAGDRHGEGAALNNLGAALHETRRYAESVAAQRDAVAIFREAGDRHGEGTALTILGNTLRGLRRFGEAMAAQQDALAIFREVGDRHGEGTALNNLGLALRGLRRFGEAVTAHQDAAMIYRETGDPHGEAIALRNIEADQAAKEDATDPD